MGASDSPSFDTTLSDEALKKLKAEEREARAENGREELRRQKALAIRRKINQEDGDEQARKAKAAQLESLLDKSEV